MQIGHKFLIIHTNINNWRLWIQKKNSLSNLIDQQSGIGPIYAKDPYEAKYQFLINKRGSTGLKNLNYCKAFIEYQNDMDDIYKNIGDYFIMKIHNKR